MAKRTTYAVPKDREEAARFLAEIGELERMSLALQVELNESIKRLTEEAMAVDKGRKRRVEELMDGLHAFAEANRDGLTEEGRRKTVSLPTGTFGWRMTPLSVTVRGAADVIRSLKRLNLKRFIRVKEEINKQALLREPQVAKTIAGVSISQKEEFIAKPAQVDLEIVRNPRKRRAKEGSEARV